MYEIVKKRKVNPTMAWLTIYAPYIARHAKPGQFVILLTDEHGERIPLTMAGHDEEAGTIDIIYATVGRTTMLFDQLEEGDCFAGVVGPLGKPTEMEGLKRVCVVAGGTGNALAYPLATGMHKAGIEVDMVSGFRNKDLVILEDEFRAGVDRVFVCTDDGSYAEKAFTTDVLRRLLQSGEHYDEIVAVGPPAMMKFVCAVAQEFGVPCIASLTSYMIDGTGMCGGCRVLIGGESKFVCVDGPEFPAEQVDWDDLIRRSAYYSKQEAKDRSHVCRLTGGVRHND